MAKTDPQSGAFPTAEHKTDGDSFVSSGLTKREYFAAKALQGLMANSTIKYDPLNNARNAVTLAKSLEQALNEQS